MNDTRVLICSIDAPFIGGTGTNSYNLIKEMRLQLNWKVAGLFFHKDSKLNNDPHNIKGIWSYVPKKHKIAMIKTKIIDYLGGYPKKVLAKNYISVLMANKFFPLVPIIFLPSGCLYYSHLLYCLKNTGIIDAVEMCNRIKKGSLVPEAIGGKLKNNINNSDWTRVETLCWPNSCAIGCDCELRACMISERCIPNSKITKNMLELIYNKWGISNKLEDEILISALYDRSTISNKIPWEVRSIDILFGCFNWKRNVKNLEIVQKIVTDSSFKNKKVVIVGSGVIPSNFKNACTNIRLTGCVDNKNMLKLLADSKLFVCPSYYDSYPNMITEATLCGSGVVTSWNVGQSEFMSRSLVINEFNDVTEWVNKINGALKKPMIIRLPSRKDIITNLAKYI